MVLFSEASPPNKGHHSWKYYASYMRHKNSGFTHLPPMCLKPTQTLTNSKNINFLNENRQMGAKPEIQLVKRQNSRETHVFSET